MGGNVNLIQPGDGEALPFEILGNASIDVEKAAKFYDRAAGKVEDL